jgi:hypothetical protein
VFYHILYWSKKKKNNQGDTSEGENYINTSRGREICGQKLIVKKNNQGC